MSLSTYNRLSLTKFSIAWSNLNEDIMFPRFHSQEEITEKQAQEDSEKEEFLDLVKSLKADRDWWNTCSALRDRGYHAEVGEALTLAS